MLQDSILEMSQQDQTLGRELELSSPATAKPELKTAASSFARAGVAALAWTLVQGSPSLSSICFSKK